MVIVLKAIRDMSSQSMVGLSAERPQSGWPMMQGIWNWSFGVVVGAVKSRNTDLLGKIDIENLTRSMMVSKCVSRRRLQQRQLQSMSKVNYKTCNVVAMVSRG